MKLILAVFTLFVLSSFSIKGNKTNLFSNNKLTIEGTTLGCNDIKNGINKEFVFLTFTNKTSKSIKVTYYTELSYNGNCSTCGNKQEYTFSVTIPANGSVSGDCSNKSQSLAIFSKMLDGVKASQLTDYSIKNVVVK